ncbi:MAG: glutaredoxin family protein [Chloroflexi bacterium]|nr:glutaredoxin family protein [Chloroflexota bacterium]
MPSVSPLPHLVLYARPGCHLCDEAREAIEAVLADREARGLPVPPLSERNIDEDAELHRRFLERIPVVELDGRRIELIVTVGQVRRLLTDVLDSPPAEGTPG